MKHISITIFLIMLFFNNVLVNAQDNISASIAKEMKGGKNYLDVTITNDNPEDIIILTYAHWGGSPAIYLHFPVSYAIVIGNPISKVDLEKPIDKPLAIQTNIETGKLLLSRDVFPSSMEELKPYLIIKAGQSHTIRYSLFGETYTPYKLFSISDESKIKKIQVKIMLTYVYSGSKGAFTKEFLSNDISM